MATTDEIKKRRQAANGSQGTTLGDNSGTGVLSDITNRIANTPSNLAQKGILGSIGQGVEDAASLSTGIGKSIIKGASETASDLGKVLFGVGDQDGSPTESVKPQLGDASSVQPATLIAAPSKVFSSPSQEVLPPRTIENSVNTSTFNNGVGGSASITSNRPFSPEQVDSLNKTLEFNALQSTKDRFARDAANTEEQNRRYGNGITEPGSKEFLQQRLAEEFKRPFLRRGVIGDLEDALKGIDANKTSRDTLASSLVTNQTKAQQEASQQAFENENKNIQIQQTATKNLFELKDKGASPIELFNRYKADTGNKPIGLGILSNIAPPDKFNAALGDPGRLKALLQEIGIPERDQISLLSEQRQQLGQ